MIEVDPPPIVTAIRGSIAVVRLNRPAHRNPLSLDTLDALKRTTSELFPRRDIHAIVFTGTADVFASGANIGELARLDVPAALSFSKYGQDLFQTIADARQVTIAAINGYCMGGGLDLALACDVRVASEGAIFSHPGARLGIITGWGGTQRLPLIIGRARALEFFATARRYSSTEALAMGLINRVGDPVLECAIKCVNHTQSAASPSSETEQFPADNPPSSWQ
jgi:enoyl-CoA hydratase